MAKWFVFGLLGLCWGVSCEENKYENYTLLKITPYTEQHLKALARFPDDPTGEVDFLKRSHGLNDTTDVLVSPNKKRLLEDFARENGMPVDFKYNYGRIFEPVDYGNISRTSNLLGFDLYGFNSYETIRKYIEELPATTSTLATVQDVGKSLQRRNMKLIKISLNPSAGNPVIFIDAGIHAREWVAPAMAMYIVHRLTTDPEARNRELAGLDWYILPVVNPDGYEYSRTSQSNRLWRKTRSRTSESDCFGVDGNRNYDYQWGVTGVSHDPCDAQIYCGPQPFSEIETRIVRDIMLKNAKKIKMYVSLHTYGHYLVYPWGYTDESLPETWRRLHNLAMMASDSVQRAGGRPFKVMSAGQWYPTSGASDDFAFGRIGIPYSYTMELTDGFEFVFPKQLLIHALPRYYEAFKTFSIQIRKEFGTT